jgi:hypothetical protein
MDREKSPSLLRYRKYTAAPFLRYARLLSRDFQFAPSTGVIPIISHKPTREEPIRGLDTHLLFASSLAARGRGVCGKLVNEIVGLAERHQ